MAHQTSHRRILTESDPKPSSMDTALKKQNKSKLTLYQKPSCKNFSKSCTREKPTVSPQYKAVTVSAIVDSSNFSLPKSNSLPRNYLPAPEIEKMSISKKEGSKESEKKFYEFIVSKKKKSREGNESKSLTGEFKNGDFEELEEGVECERRRESASLSSRGGRRRSFGGAQVEMADIFASNGVKVVAVDMPPFMQIHAVDCARKSRDSMEKFTSKTLALTLKKEFDGVYGPAWHCIVGSSFGSFVTHSVGGFLYFSMDKKLYILLFKTTVQKAD